MRLRWGGPHLLRVFAIDQQQVRHKIAAIRTDQYGERYRLEFTLERANRAATVRSAWIASPPARIPRLISSRSTRISEMHARAFQSPSYESPAVLQGLESGMLLYLQIVGQVLSAKVKKCDAGLGQVTGE